MGDLKPQEFILSPFWGPEVQNRGTLGALLPRRPWEATFLASSSSGWLAILGLPRLVDASLQPQPLPSHGVFHVRLWLPLLLKGFQSLDLGPNLFQ